MYPDQPQLPDRTFVIPLDIQDEKELSKYKAAVNVCHYLTSGQFLTQFVPPGYRNPTSLRLGNETPFLEVQREVGDGEDVLNRQVGTLTEAWMEYTVKLHRDDPIRYPSLERNAAITTNDRFQAYLHQARLKNSYVNEVEVMLMPFFLRRRVYVFQGVGLSWTMAKPQVFGDKYTNLNPVMVLYQTGNHYDGILPMHLVQTANAIRSATSLQAQDRVGSQPPFRYRFI